MSRRIKATPTLLAGIATVLACVLLTTFCRERQTEGSNAAMQIDPKRAAVIDSLTRRVAEADSAVAKIRKRKDRKDSTLRKRKTKEKEKTPRHKPRERMFLDEDIPSENDTGTGS